MKSKVFDCFLFYRELDLLEIRLAELGPRVDRFVLVEATVDFAGNPKPLYYHDNKDRFADWEDRIEHVIVDTEPAAPEVRWARQRYQRDQFLHGLSDAAPDDIVMVSDLDGIPRPEALNQAVGLLTTAPGAIVMMMHAHHYRVDLRGRERALATTRMVRRRHFQVPHLVRQFKRAYWKSAPAWADQIPFGYHSLRASGRPLRRHVIPNAGWHLTSVGAADFATAKLTAFAPDERLPPDDIAASPAARIDKGDPVALAAYDSVALVDLPTPLREDPQKYRHLFAYPPDPVSGALHLHLD
ncbi:MAG: hypothetical protein AB8B85_19770 [Paracoccaceae bacterium]